MMRKSSLMLLIAAVICCSLILPADGVFAAVKKPAKVKKLVLSVSDENQITAKWKKARFAKKYQIYVKVDNGKFKKTRTVKKTKTRIMGEPGTTYTIKVRALNGKKKGAFSKPRSIETYPPVEVSREEVAVMAVNAIGLTAPEEEDIQYSFTDVAKAGQPDLVEAAYRFGLIPESPVKFDPKKAATREFTSYVLTKASMYSPLDGEAITLDCYDREDLNYEFEDYMANDLGVFELNEGRFEPAKEVTTEEFYRAEEVILNEQKEPEVPNRIVENIDLKAGVEDITLSQDSVAVFTQVTGEGKTVSDARISKEDGEKLKTGKTYRVFNEDGVTQEAIVRITALEEDTEAGDYTVSYTVPAIEEVANSIALKGTQSEGTIEIVPEDGVQIISDGDVISNKKGKSVSKDTRIGQSLTFKLEPYKLMKLLEEPTGLGDDIKDPDASVEIGFTLDRLKFDLDYGLLPPKMNSAYVAVDSHSSIKVSIGASKEFKESTLKQPVEETWVRKVRLGGMIIPIGSTGFTFNADINLKVAMNGKVFFEVASKNVNGFQIKKGKIVKTYSDAETLSIKAGISGTTKAGIEPEAKITWFAVPLISGRFFVGRAMQGTYTEQYNEDSTSGACWDYKVYLFAEAGVSIDLLKKIGLSTEWSWEIFGADNSPVRTGFHFEDGKLVGRCTRGYREVAAEDYPKLLCGKFSKAEMKRILAVTTVWGRNQSETDGISRKVLDSLLADRSDGFEEIRLYVSITDKYKFLSDDWKLRIPISEINRYLSFWNVEKYKKNTRYGNEYTKDKYLFAPAGFRGEPLGKLTISKAQIKDNIMDVYYSLKWEDYGESHQGKYVAHLKRTAVGGYALTSIESY